MNTVKVTANPNTGKVFTLQLNEDGTPHLDKNGKKHGFIRVESRKANLGFAYNGGAKVRSTLIPMTEEAFEANKDLYTAGSVHEGQIIRKDSLEPWYKGQKGLQTKEGVAITSGGAPVYRLEVFSASQSAEDVKLASYDKVEETVNASKNLVD